MGLSIIWMGNCYSGEGLVPEVPRIIIQQKPCLKDWRNRCDPNAIWTLCSGSSSNAGADIPSLLTLSVSQVLAQKAKLLSVPCFCLLLWPLAPILSFLVLTFHEFLSSAKSAPTMQNYITEPACFCVYIILLLSHNHRFLYSSQLFPPFGSYCNLRLFCFIFFPS